jgi:hypothetical protein
MDADREEERQHEWHEWANELYHEGTEDTEKRPGE